MSFSPEQGNYPRIGLSVPQMKPFYEVVVVGSGYGAGVAASRMARTGHSVAVLEKGIERWPGEFPEDVTDALPEVHVSAPYQDVETGKRNGLYHLYVGNEQNAFVGEGLGGTSHLNANVALRMDDLTERMDIWPPEIKAEGLSKYYDRAEQMLRPNKYPDDWPVLKKLSTLERQATQLGPDYSSRFGRAPITVTFDDGLNAAGVHQNASTLTGNDCTGINDGSKTTTLVTYIADAWNHGAEIFCSCEVTYVKYIESTKKWAVFYRWLQPGRQDFSDEFSTQPFFVLTNTVFLGAGALGSTEIIMRSKAIGLPVSDNAGRSYSGNGDILAFGYNLGDGECNAIGMGPNDPKKRSITEQVGPCITGIIDMRNSPEVLNRYVIEEGVAPFALWPFLQTLFGLTPDKVEPHRNLLQEIAARARVIQSTFGGPFVGALNRTMMYLIMSHDDNQGILSLHNDKLRIAFDGVGDTSRVRELQETLARMTVRNGGVFVPGPFETPIARNGLITVHSIGGCVMGTDGSNGVTNHKGQVFKYSDGKRKTEVHTGLYVVDGAVIPAALGVNPFLTITAIAERTVEFAAKDRGWVISPRRITQAINFKMPAYAPPRPLRQVARNHEATHRGFLTPFPSQGGIAFSEVMKGYFGTNLLSDDYRTAEAQGRSSSSTMEFFLTIIAYDLHALVSLDDHSADIVGTVSCRALSADPLLVCPGSRFRLFSRDLNHVSTENLAYDLNLLATDGSKYKFEGHKIVDTRSMLNAALVWKATTTLYVTVSTVEDKGDIKAGTVMGRGILHLGVSDFVKELTGFAAWANLPENINFLPGLARLRQQLASFQISTQFVMYFARHVAEHFLPPMLQYPGSNKDMEYSTTSIKHEQWYVTTKDGGTIRMHRWNAGRKGPILLVPGASVTYEIFGTNLIPTNFVTFLTDRGYDVFSLDHRLSPTIRASTGQIAMESVRFDVEAAVSETRRYTGCINITAVVHCAGSVATFIGLLDGTISGVGHVVASQVAMHPVAASVNWLKAHLYLAPIVNRVLGVDYLEVNSAPRGLKQIAIDQALRLYPVGKFSEICGSTVCHRSSLCFGLLWHHANLNDALHSNLDKIIGGVNMTTLRQLIDMTIKKELLNIRREKVYVTPNNARKNLNFPITFIHGDKNQTYDLESTDADYNFLRNVNGPDWYRRKVFQNYGHLDTWFGVEAYKDIYPWVLEDIEYWADKNKIGYLAVSDETLHEKYDMLQEKLEILHKE
ncbi:hypothetical protein V1527DRAFT_519315 [Lipomyces starkeyi]